MLMCVFFILYGGVWTDILNPICITRQRTFVYFFLNAYSKQESVDAPIYLERKVRSFKHPQHIFQEHHLMYEHTGTE